MGFPWTLSCSCQIDSETLLLILLIDNDLRSLSCDRTTGGEKRSLTLLHLSLMVSFDYEQYACVLVEVVFLAIRK